MIYVPTNDQAARDRLRRSIGLAALNWGDMPAPPATQSLDWVSMRLLERDYHLLSLVARFGQLTTPQIRTLVFPHQKSRTPCDHALHRLTKSGLLELVAQRHPGGSRGGSSVNVLQLGPQGWPLFFQGRRRASRIIKAHSLAIADVYIALVEAEREKRIKILNYATEPDSHLELGGAYLKPDLYVDVAVHRADGTAVRRPRWIEVDMGTERQKQVLEQIAAYVAAYEARQEYPLDTFPKVVLLAVNDDRRQEINYWLRRTKDLPDIFTVGTLDDVLSIVCS